MKRQNLILYKTETGHFRTVIKTQHGRSVYLELNKVDKQFSVEECYYIDRIRSGIYYAVPKKLITLTFREDKMLSVIATELDRKYYGVEVLNSLSELSTEEFINYKLAELKRGYKFLIFIGEGELINGIPSKITTRLKNRIHRSIYLSIRYCDNKGVIEKCHYYDRSYKSKERVIPSEMTTIFLDYTRTAIMEMVNAELNCDFTDIIFITDNSINIDNNHAPLCGNI